MASAADPAATYRQEAFDLLLELEETLLDLEAVPNDRALIDKTFRALHTIKGSGAMFGFQAVAGFTHHVENAFEQVRNGSRDVSATLISLTLKSLDHIRALIASPEQSGEAGGQELLAAFVELADAPPDLTAPAKAEPEEERERSWHIRLRLAEQAMVFGTNPLLLLDDLRRLGPCSVTALTDSVPPLEEIDPAACYIAWDIFLTTNQRRSAIEDVFIFVADEAQIEIEEMGPPVGGEVCTPTNGPSSAGDEGDHALTLAGAHELVDVVPKAAESQANRDQAKAAETASVRVQASRLDSLMDQVGELVIAQARLNQLSASSQDPTLRSISEEIERLVADLRDTTMGIRMLPIGTLFGRFRRLVRDLSQSLNRPVALVTEGEETELDKTVIESLADPLVHLIRNAVDHGIEPDPDVRLRQGKPAVGQVHLSAVHSGAQVLITIADDGRGMDREAIRRKAEERGLVPPGVEIPDSELFSFIFHPGFSTAAQVSNLSGRGVGMDVVRQALDALRGTIEVASVPGHGSKITLKLPLTLAIIDGLLVRVGASRYVLPLAAVEECVDLTPEEDVRSAGRSFLNLRGDLVPFLRLRELFEVRGKPDGYQKVVIVSCGGVRIGLVVDHVIGQYQTVIKSLSRLLDTEQFSGATILGDGSVALIVDIPQLIDRAQMREVESKDF